MSLCLRIGGDDRARYNSEFTSSSCILTSRYVFCARARKKRSSISRGRYPVRSAGSRAFVQRSFRRVATTARGGKFKKTRTYERTHGKGEDEVQRANEGGSSISRGHRRKREIHMAPTRSA